MKLDKKDLESEIVELYTRSKNAWEMYKGFMIEFGIAFLATIILGWKGDFEGALILGVSTIIMFVLALDMAATSMQNRNKILLLELHIKEFFDPKYRPKRYIRIKR